MNKLDLIKFIKILHSKVNCKQNEKTTLRMGENIYKQSNQQGINLQIIQTTMQLKKKKKKSQTKNRQEI